MTLCQVTWVHTCPAHTGTLGRMPWGRAHVGQDARRFREPGLRVYLDMSQNMHIRDGPAGPACTCVSHDNGPVKTAHINSLCLLKLPGCPQGTHPRVWPQHQLSSSSHLSAPCSGGLPRMFRGLLAHVDRGPC